MSNGKDVFQREFQSRLGLIEGSADFQTGVYTAGPSDRQSSVLTRTPPVIAS
jgi:hypothetical protein